MRKRLNLLLFAFIFSLSSFAQSEYGKQYESKVREIYQHFTEKKYNEAIVVSLQLDSLFGALPASQQAENAQWHSQISYNIVCLYVLQNDVDNALIFLQQTAGLGYNNYKHLMTDADLELIRSDKRFAPIAAQVKKQGDYITLLKEEGEYASQPTKQFPSFEYQSVDDEGLKAIRTHFNLDSIAGQGDEISRIKNLLLWMHNTIMHDGNHWPSLDNYNAIEIYNYHQTTKKGVNCRALAIALNDCYLAMGFASRFVICLPKNKYDPDCHVINSVYSTTLDKWLWMDPTNNAYVMDENENLLSIAEVRDRLINDKPLILNDDANWNNKEKQVKEYYIDVYMAKNLYLFHTPLKSELNAVQKEETNKKYVYLRPVNYLDVNSKNRDVITTDPEYFWHKPQSRNQKSTRN